MYIGKQRQAETISGEQKVINDAIKMKQAHKYMTCTGS
jgi:hypothetical protein